jgi:hypothetical protein
VNIIWEGALYLRGYPIGEKHFLYATEAAIVVIFVAENNLALNVA